MYPLHIFAVDPGGTNGIVQCYVPEDGPLEIVEWTEERDMFRACSMVENFMVYSKEHDRTMMVIVESWKNLHLESNPDANLACQPIGIIRWLGHEHSVPVRLQQPQERLFVTDDILKSSGYWIRGGKGHARQALRHALTFISKNRRHMPTMLKLHPRES